MKTPVVIIGSGPAGLFTAEYLRQAGIPCIILERSSREQVEQRQRAGVLEPGTVDMMLELGAGERMLQEGMIHNGFNIVFDNRIHNVDLLGLAGRPVTVYPQTKLTQDLIRLRLENDGEIIFNAENVTPHGIESDTPKVTFEKDGQLHAIECDYIIDCGGFHGPSRKLYGNILGGVEKQNNVAWLGILAPVKPLSYEITYAHSERGFALFSMRSPEISRYYLQCDPNDNADNWSKDKIWNELNLRLGDAEIGPLEYSDAPFLAKPEIFTMSSYVADTMQVGKRLFLAGDAAHKVPATGAKGLNMAAYDARKISQALIAHYKLNDLRLLTEYSDNGIAHAKEVIAFSNGMTDLLHTGTECDHDQKMKLLSHIKDNPKMEANKQLANKYIGNFALRA